MKVLLDTNALIWAMAQTRLLSPTAAATIADKENAILISAASAWEIATKVRLGKLIEAEFLETDFLSLVTQAGYSFLSITPAIALRAGRFQVAHRDPFDRIIAAHALQNDIPVISPDSKLDLFGVRRIW